MGLHYYVFITHTYIHSSQIANAFVWLHETFFLYEWLSKYEIYMNDLQKWNIINLDVVDWAILVYLVWVEDVGNELNAIVTWPNKLKIKIKMGKQEFYNYS